MALPKVFWWLLTVSLLSTKASSQNCQKCPIAEESICQACDCGVIDNVWYINCRGRNLDQVPTFITSGIDYTDINLAKNNIVDIPGERFTVFSTVTTLDFSDNRIDTISRKAFHGLNSSLLKLSLATNKMTTFPKEALSILENLQMLTLTGFDWSSSGLPQDAMGNLRQLQQLYLPENMLRSLNTGALSGQYSNLEELYLDDNSFTSGVPTFAISQLQGLIHLSMVASGLTSLPSNSFQDAKVKSLDLNQNALSSNIDANAFQGLETRLESLSLSTCQLGDNSLLALQGLSALQDLDLSQNDQIANIPDNFFSQMSSLQVLNLHSNGLRSLQANTLTGISSLLELDISDNLLDNMNSNVFSSTPQLKDLDLADNTNLARNLPPGIFQSIQSLEELNLEGTGFSHTHWAVVSHLSKLKILQLSNNGMTDLVPMGMENMTRLETLVLSQNNLAEMTQEHVYGPRDTLTSVHLNQNQLTTLSECMFYEFGSQLNYYQLNLNENPLHCDCHLLWLLQELKKDPQYENKATFVGWICASPPNLANKRFADEVDESDLVCSPSETSPPCLDLTPTTTTTTPTPVTYPITTFNLNITNVTDTTVTMYWVVSHTEGLTGFRVEYWILPDGEKGYDQYPASVTQRSVSVEDLEPDTDYNICIIAQGVEWDSATSACESLHTMPPFSGSTGSESNKGLIIGLSCVIGILIISAIIIIVVVALRKKSKKKKKEPGYENEGFAGVSLGYDSKRFSRPNRDTIDQQNQDNLHMQKKIEGFTKDERDRILGLVSMNGASTLSMISNASGNRYVRELPPTPRAEEQVGYLNPMGIQDDPDKHVYCEIPGEKNYQEIPDSFI